MKNNIKRVLFLLLGLVLYSLSFNIFLSPNDLVFGGISGLSIIIESLFNIETSIFIFIANSIILLLSYFLLGKEMTLKSIVGSLLLPIFIKLSEPLAYFITETVSLELASIYVGVLAGFGLGLVYKVGFTTGGTDILNQIFNKSFGISIGTIMILIDGVILASSIFVFGFVKSMYALISLFIISKLTDRVILGISNSKTFYIITDEPSKVKEFVIKKMGHGITEFNAYGGFKKESQKVLFCVIPTYEYFKLKQGISEIDKEAFFVVLDSYEVKGGA